MPLYLVKRRSYAGWDDTRAVVVRANNADRALAVAVAGVYSHERTVFADPKQVEVIRIKSTGEEEVILTDVKAG